MQLLKSMIALECPAPFVQFLSYPLVQMYGPPRDCKGKVRGWWKWSAQMYSASEWSEAPSHDELRTYRS